MRYELFAAGVWNRAEHPAAAARNITRAGSPATILLKTTITTYPWILPVQHVLSFGCYIIFVRWERRKDTHQSTKFNNNIINYLTQWGKGTRNEHQQGKHIKTRKT